MRNRNKWLSIGLAAVMMLTMTDAGMGVEQADAATETVAYLGFSSKWGESYTYGEDSKAIPDNAAIDGYGVYSVALDLTGVDAYFQCAHGIGECVLNIKDGESLYGSNSVIKIRSVKVNGEEIALNGSGGYTYADSAGQTSLCLYRDYAPDATNVRWTSGLPANPTENDYQLLKSFADKGMTDTMDGIKTIEVVFAFAENAVELSKIPADATPKPHQTGGDASPSPSAAPSESPSANPTESPSDSPSPTPSVAPTNSPAATTTPIPTFTAKPIVTGTPVPWLPTASPEGSALPTNPPAGPVSNSTYTGAEKIFVNKSAVVIPAGKSESVTIALLRGAASATQVTASSGNKSIAVPALQSNGRMTITVPANAPAGGSTVVTLRFGSSSVSVKVTVSNPVTQLKGAKKSYTVKRKKTAKVSVKLKVKNKSAATTDRVCAKISKKKIATITLVKISKSKVTIKVKGLKKGSAKLKVKAGGKSVTIKIRVK